MAFLRRSAKAICALFSALAAVSLTAQATTPLGETVSNVAQVTYEHSSGPLSVDTNVADFTVVARPTPSTIEFFRYAPHAPDHFTTQINGSDYSPTGETHNAEFLPLGAPVSTGGNALDFSGDVPLIPAETYFSGELMVLRVTDAGQNGDPERIETVIITIETTGGDQICLRLYESGANTGEFYGYVPSTSEPSAANDAKLTAPKDTELTARYVDVFDATEVSIDTALVDPFGRLFDSLTGELVDGAEVTIVEADTGAPAEVFGVDGISPYPSTLMSGTTVTDAGGTVYELDPGEFLFPLMAPGDYRLVITPPGGYVFPSGFGATQFESLDNAPFEIISGSYGQDLTVLASGPLNFDVPLDTTRGLTVTKRSGQTTAAIGDFVSYSVTAENSSDTTLPMLIRDELPRGLRYESGSARVEDTAITQVELSENGRAVTFDAGLIAPGTKRTLTYVAAVGAGTPQGTAVNSAAAVNPLGRALSNTAEAAIEIREDFLRSELTLVGRVSEDACRPEEDWARDIEDGKGVAGVRLYLETGEYVVTDDDGLFHFEGVEARTHVLQLDRETLPKGLEPVMCEENTRYAGSAHSQFVDAQGGMIWRANFYLERTGDEAVSEASDEADDTLEYKQFDQDWLDTQSGEVTWVYPDTSRTPSHQSVNLGIKTPLRASVSLTLNGRDVPATNVQSRLTSAARTGELHRWRGVDISRGENKVVAKIRLADGTTQSLERSIWFVDQAQRARLVDDQSVLVADGRTRPVVAIRLEDASGHAVHAGRVVDVDVADPYRLMSDAQREERNPVATNTIEVTGVHVGPDGIARIELEPTLATGRVRVRVPLKDGRHKEITAYMRPEKRDWILVGLAEGELGLRESEGPGGQRAEETMQDGRLAFFAKGMIRGDWLMTLAVDTAKRRGREDDSLFERINPNAYYTLYGDRTWQNHDAESRYPVYVKLEKDTAQILFGDFNTDMSDTELGRYNRRLSGLRGVFEGETVAATGFAAETNQGFVKDEIAADGTSGPYRLSVSPIVRNSEILSIETRNRLRPDEVTNVRTLTRYVDYEIDYDTGELLLRAPISATDTQFNDNVIVADYETFSDAERNTTYGGRVALRTDDRRFEVGLGHVHEEGSAIAPGMESEITTLDATARLTENTEIRAEVARSERRPGLDGGDEQTAEAYLVEAIHQGEAVAVSGYVREEQAGFGVGQTGSNTNGIRRYGVQASALVAEINDSETGERATRTLSAQAYREEALASDEVRTVGELGVQHAGQLLTVGAGLRAVDESLSSGPRESLQASANVSRAFPELGLTVTAAREQPLGGRNDDEASLFPQRTILGADKLLTQRATLNLRHEVIEGENASGANTIAGVTYVPWAGGRINTALNQVTQDSARRLSATVGVDQTFQINETWSASLGMSNRSSVDGDEAPRDPLADAAVSPLAEGERSPLTLDESFTSAYGGLGYRDALATGSLRGEYRETATSQRWAVILGGAREASETLSFAGTGRYQSEVSDFGGHRRAVDLRGAAAWRPRGEGPIVFNRLDFKQEEVVGDFATWKLVNNLGVNTMLSDASQLSVQNGLKYTETRLAGVDVEGWAGLLGAQLRHDFTARLDAGLQGSVMHTTATGTTEWSFGPSIGFSPKENVWASVGYNLTGFEDRDFKAAEYTRNGLYIKLRLKFDEDSLDWMLDQISPKAR